MMDQIIERLKALQAEHDAGHKLLAELDARRVSVANTLLRIEGAIQVLKEMTGASNGAAPSGAAPYGAHSGLTHAALPG